MINILLTCAGRRNYLVKYFQEALNGNGLVFAADTVASAPAMHEADGAFIVPEVYADNYIEFLLDICRNYRIALLISLNDLELPVLACHRARFLETGTFPLVSDTNVIETCFDKWAAWAFLEGIDVDSPKTFLTLESAIAAIENNELALPVVVKPRWGTASQNIEYPETMQELLLAERLVRMRIGRSMLSRVSMADPKRCLLIQEYLDGQEFGLDVINDLNGNFVTTFVKRKLGMRAGETDKACTVENKQLSALGEKIGRALGHVANLDCDVFISARRACVLEMNPRFGGGYPFSHQAGADLPAAVLSWLKGRKPRQEWLSVEPEVMSAKCDRILRVHETFGTLSNRNVSNNPDGQCWDHRDSGMVLRDKVV